MRGELSYVWAQDEFFDEPVFGIAPREERYAIHLHTQNRQRWAEVGVTRVVAQDRVADSRFELPTAGWTVVDVRAGVQLGEGVGWTLGIENIGDESYATHLHSLNPFTLARIREIGRSFHTGLEYTF